MGSAARTLTPGIETAISLPTSSRLLEDLQAELVEQIATRAAASVAPPKRIGAPDLWLGAAIATWLAVIGLLLLRPAVVAPPASHPFTPPAVQREASLRYGVWLARGAVLRFVAEHHRLPSFLAETGFSDSTIALRATGERSFELEGQDGAATVMLASDASAEAFLGESLTLLQAQ
ncbi:MAG: hypothetical protein ABJC19_03030 [Gemmatimonadota bacterium]